jgi:SAM-dependent methyltransferase
MSWRPAAAPAASRHARAIGRVRAFEPDQSARARAAAKSGIDIQPGFLPHDLPADFDGFDLIAALDVLEHVDDDLGSFRALGQRLRPGGHLFVTVPAYPSLWSRHDDLHHHKRRYDKARLLQAFGGAGLAPRFLSFFNTLLFPLVRPRLVDRAPTAAAMTTACHRIDQQTRRVFAAEPCAEPHRAALRPVARRYCPAALRWRRHPCQFLRFGLSALPPASRISP